VKVCQSSCLYLLENQLPQRAHARADKVLKGQHQAEKGQASWRTVSPWDSSSPYLVRTFPLTPAAARARYTTRTKGPYINGSLLCDLGWNNLRRFHTQDTTLVTPWCIQRLAAVNLLVREHACSQSAVTPSAYSLSGDTGLGKVRYLSGEIVQKSNAFRHFLNFCFSQRHAVLLLPGNKGLSCFSLLQMAFSNVDPPFILCR